MAGSVTGLHVFGPDTGPEALSLLDTNYSALTAALNTLNNFSNYYIDSGAVNTLTVTVAAPQVVALTDGLVLDISVNVTTTSTTPTLNVNALGAKTLIAVDGTALPIGALRSGGRYRMQYDGTNFRVLSVAGVNGVTSIGQMLVNPGATAGTSLIQPFADVQLYSLLGRTQAGPGIQARWDSGSANRFFDIGTYDNVGTWTTVFRVGGSAGFNLSCLGPIATTLVDLTADSSTFTGAGTGFTAATNFACTWTRIGKLVILNIGPNTGASNATTFTMTGLPAAIQPATLDQWCPVATLVNNSGPATGPTGAIINHGSGTVTFTLNGSSTGFTAAGTKGTNTSTQGQVISYLLN